MSDDRDELDTRAASDRTGRLFKHLEVVLQVLDEALTGNPALAELRADELAPPRHGRSVQLVAARDEVRRALAELENLGPVVPSGTVAPRPPGSGDSRTQRRAELGASPPSVECRDLSDPGRLAALAESGLGAGSDSVMEWFAERVRHWMGVPVALVSLVRADEQVFPGAVGLPDPFSASRRTPLTHSFCQYVAATGRPLVIEDAREDPTLASNLAVPELGVVAYAGMPLTDEAGHVLGSLCAIDHVPRSWTRTDLDALGDLAIACSAELRLRLARADADFERSRRDRLELSLRDSFERSQTLLDISRSLGDSTTVEDVRAGLADLAGGLLGADHVTLLLLDGDELRPVGRRDADGKEIDSTSPAPAELAPSLLAVRERRLVACASREEFDATFSSAARDRLDALGLHAVVAAPVLSAAAAIGSLVLGWDRPREHSPADLLLVNTVAAYTARALEHVGWVQHRVAVAREMQQAMLTELPLIAGLELAAHYEPADAREYVGGDWYDVLPLPDPLHPGGTAVSLSVGDIVGHELGAAIAMGQVRSMLRQAAWDHPDGPPSRIARAFETANTGVELRAAGTAVIAHVRQLEDGAWSLRWTNAGHPPPILVRPDGGCQLLDAHDAWFGLPAGHVESRHDHDLMLPGGSMLVLYTDGLVERPGTDLDERIRAVRSTAARLGTSSAATMVDGLVEAFGRGAGDDIVVLAVRFA